MPEYRRPSALFVAPATAVLTVAGAIVISPPAAADHSLQAMATLTTGYTNNVELVPDNADPTLVPPVESDAFANIAPGMVFSHNGPRITQVVRYQLDIRMYYEQSDANSFSNSLAYGAVIPLSPRAGLTFDLGAQQGRLNAFNNAPQNTQIQTQANGDQSFVQASTGLGHSYQLTPSWQSQLSAGAQLYQPLEETVQIGRRVSTEAAVSLSKTFNYHAFTFTARGNYSTVDSGEDPTNPRRQLPDQKTFELGPELRWVHDVSEDFSLDAMIGLSVTWPQSRFEEREEFPVGAAYIRYTHDRYAASIGYRHTVATNIIVGETEVTHVGEARGVIPLPFSDRLSLAGSLGYANGQTVGAINVLTGEEVTAHTEEWIGDVAATWQINDAVGSSLRWQTVRQRREDPRLMDMLMGDSVERTSRQQITLMLEVRYPTRQAAELPRDASTRVDGGLESMTKREQSIVR